MVTDNMKDLEIAMEVEMEYQLEDVEMGTYEEWLEGELLEMGIDWEQDDLVHKEENMMVVGSQQYPPHHSEGSYPPQSPPTIAEKGVEGGDGGGVSVTKDVGTDASLEKERCNIKKSTVGGRRCVNTQTGSVRVAVSQSNNVIFGHTVEYSFGQSGGRDDPASMVKNGQSEQRANMKNVTGMNNIHTLSNSIRVKYTHAWDSNQS